MSNDSNASMISAKKSKRQQVSIQHAQPEVDELVCINACIPKSMYTKLQYHKVETGENMTVLINRPLETEFTQAMRGGKANRGVQVHPCAPPRYLREPLSHWWMNPLPKVRFGHGHRDCTRWRQARIRHLQFPRRLPRGRRGHFQMTHMARAS